MVVATGVAGLVVLALSAAGTPGTQAELNDGGIWVTNASGSEYSRFIKAIREQDSPGSVDSKDFDIQQAGSRVLIVDRVDGSIRVIDPSTTQPSAPIALPTAESTVSLGGPAGAENVAIVDPAGGRFWFMPFDQVGTMTPKTEPTGNAGAGAVAAVAMTGTAFVAAPADNQLLRITMDGAAARVEPSNAPEGLLTAGTDRSLDLEVSAVGDEPLVLSRGTGSLWSSGTISQVGALEGVHLQQPGPADAAALVASRQGLLSVPLVGGSPTSLGEPVTTVVDPPSPVRVGRCAYGAFQTENQTMQVKACEGVDALSQPLLSRSGEPVEASGTSSLRYRINRGLLVLNDARYGALWDPDDPTLKRLDKWDQLAALKKEKEESQEDDDSVAELACQKAGGGNKPPTVEDDEVGARPEQPVVIDVLANDSDVNCDVLAIADPEKLDDSQGSIALVAQGRKLQFTPAKSAAGATVRFPYTATDGSKGGKSKGTVTVRVSAVDRANQAPKAERTASTVVEQGKSVTYNVMSDFLDPDGDPLYLTSAAVDADKGSLRYSPDGTIIYKDGGHTIGRVKVDVQVSDGQTTGKGILEVNVRREGNLAPTARSDYARTPAGEPVTVYPLANDSDPNEDELRLVEVTETDAKGLKVRVDKLLGRVTFAAADPGSYAMDYLISDGGEDTIGKIRVDVTGRTTNAPPVAMVDVAEALVGQTTPVDVLVNDFDPDGDVLIAGDPVVEASARSAVRVAAVDHRFVKVTLLKSIPKPVAVTYQLSDGANSAQGTIIVREVPGGGAQPEPVAVEDAVRVRPGGRVTINVLANDLDPLAEGLTLAGTLVSEPTAGQAFVNGTAIRYAAGSEPGKFPFEYRIIDGQVNRAVGKVSVQVADVGQNSPPNPPAVETRVNVDGTVNIALPLVGTDPDGDQVMLDSVAGSKFGNPVRILPGSTDTIEYRATAIKVGTDVVEYEVCDLVADRRCVTGIVRVGVMAGGRNSPPVAQADRVTVRPDRQVGVDVLANDADPDGDTLTLDPAGLRSKDALAVEAVDNLVVFTGPAEGDYSVTYALTDSINPSENGHLAIAVRADAPLLAPIARDDTIDLSTLAVGQKSAAVPVLANDVDPDGNRADLLVEVPTGTAGAFANPDGTVQVDLGPQARVVEYSIVDPDGKRGHAYILLPPVQGAQPLALKPTPALEVEAGKSLSIELASVVTDPDNGPDPLRIVADATSANPTSQGTLVTGPTSLGYQPAADSSDDQAVISVAVTDGEFDRTFQIPIRVIIPNRPPQFSEVVEDVEKASTQPLVIDLQSAVSEPDTADRDTPATFSGLTRAGARTVKGDLKSDGTLTASAEGGASVGDTATFTFTVTDAGGESVQGSAVISVVATKKDPPATSPDTIERLDEGATKSKNVVDNDFDPFEGEPNAGLTLTQASAQSGGVGVTWTPDGSISVTAKGTYAGTARVVYTVRDAAERTADGVLEIFVWGRPTAPGAPTEAKDGATATSVRLTWAGSEANSFSPDPDARQLTYRVDYAGGSKECLDASCTVGSLTPGKSYSFTVTAINAVGESPPSRPSAPIVPDALPTAPSFRPLAGDAAYGDGRVALAWSQPSFEGSRILEYELQISPGGRKEKVASGASSMTVSGLKNGTEYSFTLTAINAKGRTSSQRYLETPTAVPGAPGGVKATADDGPAGKAIDVTWQAAVNGGDDGMTYTVVLYSGTSVVATKKDVAGTSIGLVGDNGKTYRVGVTATNRKGTGPEAKSDAVTPFGAPGVVGGLSATATGVDGEVQLAFSAPSQTGGTPAGSITYDVDTGSGWRALAGSKMVTGLKNVSQTIKVRANNPKSGDSSAVTVTPYGPPLSPEVTISGVTDSGFTLGWQRVPDNGRPVDHLLWAVSTGNPSQSWDKADLVVPNSNGSAVVSGLSCGVRYNVLVSALDAAGKEGSTTKQVTLQGCAPPPPAPYVTISRGAAGSGGLFYIRFEMFNGPAGALIGCSFTNPQRSNWQRNIQLNGNGYGSSASQEGTGTTWYWNFAGNISGECNGIPYSQNF